MTYMRKRQANLAIPLDLLERFDVLCAEFGHKKEMWVTYTAAMLMFESASDEERRHFILEVRKHQHQLVPAAETLVADATLPAPNGAQESKSPAKVETQPARPRKKSRKKTTKNKRTGA